MALSPFSRRAATLLAATYVVVGATGDALHYLVSGDAAQSDAAQSDAPRLAHHGLAHGYFHQHGDGLWHHHHGPAEADGRTREQGADARSKSCTGLRAPVDGHRDHGVLLLALVSQLEESLAPAGVVGAESREPGLARTDGSRRVAALRLATLGARGPPAGRVA
ncbi:hypothetical protein [Botrimarina sp.]|uniref:hypothetical protein n=1 Tax=Botrimarina sp. TaxID=2795802 RepID=UPI0032EBDA16